MTLNVKPGTRLFSAVDSTELIAIKAPAASVELTLGGVSAALDSDGKTQGAVIEGHASGVMLGKRYVDSAETIELLVVKAGDAVPALDGEILVPKDSKPLPASD